MFEYWFAISYRKVFFWAGAVVFFIASGTALYYRDVFQASIEKSLADQRLPTDKKPARFLEVQGTVQVKKVGRPDWIPAQRVDELQPGDLIQTHRNSSAKVAFFDGSMSVLGPDSLTSIVESHETQKQIRSVAVEVSSGAIDLATGRKHTPQDRASLMTPDAEARLREYSEAEARYDREQRMSDFYIFSGGAEVSTREERSSQYSLEEREGLTLEKGEKSDIRTYSLPDAPQLVSPADAAVIPAARRAQIRLEWRPVEGVDTYEVKVYAAASFSQPLLSERVRGNGLLLPPLKEGIYSWQVQSVSAENGVSRSNRLFKFAVVQHPPGRRNVDIRIHVDEVIQIGNMYEVIGRTDPGVHLEINGEPVQVEGNGSFKHFTHPLPAAARELEIRAQDLSGVTRVLKYPLSR